MTEILITRSSGKVLYQKVDEATPLKSKYPEDMEVLRKSMVRRMVDVLMTAPAIIGISLVASKYASASTENPAEGLREGFENILDIFTAIAEPILWFYALTACILMATKNKDSGIQKLKQVAYAYAGIALLPTFFALLRWLSEMIKGSIHF